MLGKGFQIQDGDRRSVSETNDVHKMPKLTDKIRLVNYRFLYKK